MSSVSRVSGSPTWLRTAARNFMAVASGTWRRTGRSLPDTGSHRRGSGRSCRCRSGRGRSAGSSIIDARIGPEPWLRRRTPSACSSATCGQPGTARMLSGPAISLTSVAISAGVGRARHEQAVGAGGAVAVGASMLDLEPLGIVAELQPVAVGAGVDDDVDAGLARRLAGGADLVAMQLDVDQVGAADVGAVLDVDARRRRARSPRGSSPPRPPACRRGPRGCRR